MEALEFIATFVGCFAFVMLLIFFSAFATGGPDKVAMYWHVFFG